MLFQGGTRETADVERGGHGGNGLWEQSMGTKYLKEAMFESKC